MRLLNTRRIFVQVKEWKDKDELVPKEEVVWQVVRQRMDGWKHRTEQCKEFGWRS